MWPATKVSAVAVRGSRVLDGHDGGVVSASISDSQVTGSKGPFLVGHKKTVKFFTNGRVAYALPSQA